MRGAAPGGGGGRPAAAPPPRLRVPLSASHREPPAAAEENPAAGTAEAPPPAHPMTADSWRNLIEHIGKEPSPRLGGCPPLAGASGGRALTQLRRFSRFPALAAAQQPPEVPLRRAGRLTTIPAALSRLPTPPPPKPAAFSEWNPDRTPSGTWQEGGSGRGRAGGGCVLWEPNSDLTGKTSPFRCKT